LRVEPSAPEIQVSKIVSNHSWTPILTGEIAKRAWPAVHAISDAILTHNYPARIHAGALHPGYEDALLYRYLAAPMDDSRWMDRAFEHLNDAIDDAQSLIPSLRLFAGLSGLGWTIEHLSRFDGNNLSTVAAAGDDRDSNAEIDSALLRALERGIWSGPYDLISGLVGFGVYFLERLPAENATRGIRAVISHLDALSRCVGEGITWHSRPDLLPEWQRQRYPDGYYNLGVAHGVPGVLYFLSEVAERGLDKRAERMLEGAMAWLLLQRRPPGTLSWFAPWIAAEEPDDTRLAWCYGDLGIAAVLLRISRRTGRADWRTFAAGLLENCLAWPIERAGVNDAPLCHGAAGAAHIFNRIYQDEGD
jgi:lantibiotic biosynthesis protein